MVSMMKKKFFCVLFLVGCACAFAQEVSNEARDLFDRGLEALGQARTRQELKAVARTFQEAKRLAPLWPDVHYALGRIYDRLEDHGQAAAFLEGYLELVSEAVYRDEIIAMIRAGRQKQERIEEIKRRMTDGRSWTWLGHVPPVRFASPSVTTRFRLDAKGRMSAMHPYLEVVEKPRLDAIRQRGSPVEFDGRYFEYEYKVYFKALEPPRTEYELLTVRGEIIPGNPDRIKQAVYHKVSPTLRPGMKNEESFEGEVFHELR